MFAIGNAIKRMSIQATSTPDQKTAIAIDRLVDNSSRAALDRNNIAAVKERAKKLLQLGSTTDANEQVRLQSNLVSKIIPAMLDEKDMAPASTNYKAIKVAIIIGMVGDASLQRRLFFLLQKLSADQYQRLGKIIPEVVTEIMADATRSSQFVKFFSETVLATVRGTGTQTSSGTVKADYTAWKNFFNTSLNKWLPAPSTASLSKDSRLDIYRQIIEQLSDDDRVDFLSMLYSFDAHYYAKIYSDLKTKANYVPLFTKVEKRKEELKNAHIGQEVEAKLDIVIAERDREAELKRRQLLEEEKRDHDTAVSASTVSVKAMLATLSEEKATALQKSISQALQTANENVSSTLKLLEGDESSIPHKLRYFSFTKTGDDEDEELGFSEYFKRNFTDDDVITLAKKLLSKAMFTNVDDRDLRGDISYLREIVSRMLWVQIVTDYRVVVGQITGADKKNAFFSILNAAFDKNTYKHLILTTQYPQYPIGQSSIKGPFVDAFSACVSHISQINAAEEKKRFEIARLVRHQAEQIIAPVLSASYNEANSQLQKQIALRSKVQEFTRDDSKAITALQSNITTLLCQAFDEKKEFGFFANLQWEDNTSSYILPAKINKLLSSFQLPQLTSRRSNQTIIPSPTVLFANINSTHLESFKKTLMQSMHIEEMALVSDDLIRNHLWRVVLQAMYGNFTERFLTSNKQNEFLVKLLAYFLGDGFSKAVTECLTAANGDINAFERAISIRLLQDTTAVIPKIKVEKNIQDGQDTKLNTTVLLNEEVDPHFLSLESVASSNNNIMAQLRPQLVEEKQRQLQQRVAKLKHEIHEYAKNKKQEIIAKQAECQASSEKNALEKLLNPRNLGDLTSQELQSYAVGIRRSSTKPLTKQEVEEVYKDMDVNSSDYKEFAAAVRDRIFFVVQSVVLSCYQELQKEPGDVIFLKRFVDLLNDGERSSLNNSVKPCWKVVRKLLKHNDIVNGSDPFANFQRLIRCHVENIASIIREESTKLQESVRERVEQVYKQIQNIQQKVPLSQRALFIVPSISDSNLLQYYVAEYVKEEKLSGVKPESLFDIVAAQLQLKFAQQVAQVLPHLAALFGNDIELFNFLEAQNTGAWFQDAVSQCKMGGGSLPSMQYFETEINRKVVGLEKAAEEYKKRILTSNKSNLLQTVATEYLPQICALRQLPNQDQLRSENEFISFVRGHCDAVTSSSIENIYRSKHLATKSVGQQIRKCLYAGYVGIDKAKVFFEQEEKTRIAAEETEKLGREEQVARESKDKEVKQERVQSGSSIAPLTITANDSKVKDARKSYEALYAMYKNVVTKNDLENLSVFAQFLKKHRQSKMAEFIELTNRTPEQEVVVNAINVLRQDLLQYQEQLSPGQQAEIMGDRYLTQVRDAVQGDISLLDLESLDAFRRYFLAHGHQGFASMCSNKNAVNGQAFELIRQRLQKEKLEETTVQSAETQVNVAASSPVVPQLAGDAISTESERKLTQQQNDPDRSSRVQKFEAEVKQKEHEKKQQEEEQKKREAQERQRRQEEDKKLAEEKKLTEDEQQQALLQPLLMPQSGQPVDIQSFANNSKLDRVLPAEPNENASPPASPATVTSNSSTSSLASASDEDGARKSKRGFWGVALIVAAILVTAAIAIFAAPYLAATAALAALVYSAGVLLLKTSELWRQFAAEHDGIAKGLSIFAGLVGLALIVACPLLLLVFKPAIATMAVLGLTTTAASAATAGVLTAGAAYFAYNDAEADKGVKYSPLLNSERVLHAQLAASTVVSKSLNPPEIGYANLQDGEYEQPVVQEPSATPRRQF